MDKTPPFKFGQVVKNDQFTNRTKEIELISNNYINLVSTTLISPRRWGKSSLVRRAAKKAQAKDKSIKVCFIDLYKARTEEEFYQLFTKELLKATANKVTEIGQNIKEVFKQFIPKISYSPMEDTEFNIGLNWQEVKKHPDEILNLAETLAIKKKIKLIVCIDEFQNLGFFQNSIAFQKKLRANWQNHQQVAYCMYGSKRHMMLEVFTDQSMPFYQFGSLIFLEKINEKDWIKFIKKQFKKTDKSIENEEAALIAQLMENHPYYVQQLAHISWLNTPNNCTADIVNKSFDQLLHQLSLLFQNLTDQLSTKQVNLMEAIIRNEPSISSSATIKKYKLGTSGTVNRSKNALIEKEILDNFSGTLEFVDPAYKGWLSTYYFNTY